MGRYIATNKDKIIRTDTYLVRVECADGTVFEDLEPRRLFPLSNLNNYITLLDKREKEVVLIKALEDLQDESRQAIEDCFADYYMIPVITEIIDVHDRFGVLKWRVMTDRGEIEFSIKNRHSDIKVFDNKQLFVRDSNDNRYLGDITKLNKKSLHKIFCYI